MLVLEISPYDFLLDVARLNKSEESDIALARAAPVGQMPVVGLVYSPEMTRSQWRICDQIQTLVERCARVAHRWP